MDTVGYDEGVEPSIEDPHCVHLPPPKKAGAIEHVKLQVRCVYCGDYLPGVWYDVPLWYWCNDCRVWWLYLRQHRRRHRQATRVSCRGAVEQHTTFDGHSILKATWTRAQNMGRRSHETPRTAT